MSVMWISETLPKVARLRSGRPGQHLLRGKRDQLPKPEAP
jgi:hypothetical protein